MKVEYKTANQTGLLLNANELSLNVSKDIIEEMKQSLDDILFNRYPDDRHTELMNTYASIMNVDPDCLMVGNGSDAMLGFCIGYYLGKGKKLYTLLPDFMMYDFYAGNYEASIEKYILDVDQAFNVDDFINYGKSKDIDMVLFSNPNNPTGMAISKEDLIKIITSFDCPVVIDEAYAEFFDGSMVQETKIYPNLLITRTLSKAYGLASLRVGFLIGNKETMNTLKRYKTPYAFNSVSSKLATIVLKHAPKYQQYVQDIINEREVMYNFLKELSFIQVYPSNSNFIFCKSKYTKQLQAIFEENNVQLRFYGNDMFRITIGLKEENEIVKSIFKGCDFDE